MLARASRPWARHLVAVSVAGALLLSGCGGDGDDEADAAETTEAPTTEAAEEPTTTEAGDTSTTEGASGGGVSGGVGDGDSDEGEEPEEIEADEDAPDVAWNLNATEYRGQDGLRVGYDCPADGEPGAIWGSGAYTDDTSVCTAGVHAGLIDLEDGGRVVIEISPGLEEYTGSEANGIESADYGPWGGSFFFPAAPPAG